MYPRPPIAHVFAEAPGRIRVTPSPGLFAPIVAAEARRSVAASPGARVGGDEEHRRQLEGRERETERRAGPEVLGGPTAERLFVTSGGRH